MRDEYKLTGTTIKIQVEVEATVNALLRDMEAHSGLSVSEIANTALKRFISSHKDFLPLQQPKPKD